MIGPEGYPRKLTQQERDFLYWLLPQDRPGYSRYRDLLDTLFVLGEGRRGKGNLVLGHLDDKPEGDAPLAPVFAFGVIEGEDEDILVTIREEQGQQVEVEIVGSKSDEVSGEFREKRRWCYSTWSPGDPSSYSGERVRQVRMKGKGNDELILVISPAEKRLWVYDATNQVNHLIPVTNYYNELMLLKGVRDPNLALQSANLFSRLSEFSDEDLARAFLSYNRMKKKVEVTPGPVEIKHEISGWRRLLRSLLGKNS